ncbi:MAG: ABC-F family ATP-binding cassette domain-containing protein [Clostridia bacterium]|nr:ABC-F family ATP-binding cassette domain-containing protein [Clostridia bacterium]
MAVLSAFNVEMYFGDRLLFKEVCFDIGERERVALVGPNGTGKTTLFKLITGELEPTGGQVIKSKNAVLGYMEQHACADSERTVYDEMLTVFEDLIAIETRLEDISVMIHLGSGDIDELIREQGLLQEKFERMDGLTFRSRTRAALLGLGFTESDFYLKCTELSGGQRSKLSLGKLLLSGADILLLDEPTNHLDIDSVEWLEGFLKEYKGSAVIISHDRYFLDRVTEKTMDFARNTLRVWKGNYSEYLKQKEAFEEHERKVYENLMDEIRHIEEIIEQQKRFGRERNFITIESKQKMLEKKKAELVVPEAAQAKVHFKFKATAETGNEVLVVKDFEKGFDNKLLFSDVSFGVYRGDRIFLLGANGTGKTTFLRILHGETKADNGTFKLGSNVKLGYFDQSLENLNQDKTVIDEIWDDHKSMTMTEVRNALAAFLIRGDDVFKKVSQLSGGEKARTALLKLVLSGANFLVLDEPTNHLDINSREALENALLSYGGTMLVVSHDRYFINKLCTRVIQFTKSGAKEFIGNYDEYMEKRYSEQTVEKPVAKVNTYKQKKERESERRKLDGKIRRCEEAIEKIEDEISVTNDILSSPETASDYEKIIEFTEKLNELKQKQEELLIEWEELSEERVKLGDE